MAPVMRILFLFLCLPLVSGAVEAGKYSYRQVYNNISTIVSWSFQDTSLHYTDGQKRQLSLQYPAGQYTVTWQTESGDILSQTTVSLPSNQIIFSGNKTKSLSIPGNSQYDDPGLLYRLTADAAGITEKISFTLILTNGRTLPLVLLPSGPDNLSLLGELIPALKYEIFSARGKKIRATIWMRQTDGLLLKYEGTDWQGKPLDIFLIREQPVSSAE